MFATIMTVLTFVVVLVFSVQPLFVSRGRSRSSYKVTAEALELRKLLLYEQIKELELEYEMGSISSADFQLNRSELKREVSTVLNKMNSLSSE